MRAFGWMMAAMATGFAINAAEPAATTPWLRFDVAPGMGMGTGYTQVNGMRFRVDLAEAEGEFKTVWHIVYGNFNQWYPQAIDLSPYAGKTVNIRLITEYIENRVCQDYPFWGDPRIGRGNFAAGAEGEVVERLALRAPDRMGQLLPDGTVAPLDEDGLFFGYEGTELVQPAKINRWNYGMVFGGKNYITVTGKSQPGLYIGFDMSHSFGGGCAGIINDPVRIAQYKEHYRGTAPFHESLGIDVAFPYLGPVPPPVFAEYTVAVPATEAPAPKPEAAAFAGKTEPTRRLPALALRRDVYRFSPGWDASFDPKTYQWECRSGRDAGAPGWALAGLESSGFAQVPLVYEVEGEARPTGDNAFAGLVVDYHTPLGYQRRAWLALDESVGAPRDDLRPGAWILDAAAYSLRQRLGFEQTFAVLPAGRQTLDLGRYAPADWDGRFTLSVAVQNVEPGLSLRLALENPEATEQNPALATPADATEDRFVLLRDGQRILAISRLNGALCGAWDGETGEAWLGEAADSYQVEGRYSMSEASELLDRVRRVVPFDDPARGVTLYCENPALPPGTTLVKTHYFLPDGRWSKKLQAETDSAEGFFFRWTPRGGVAEELRATGRRGAGFGPAKRVAQGKVVEEDDAAPPEQGGMERPVMFTKRDFSAGIGAYRARVNDRFVLLSASKYLPGGWELMGFCDFLKAGKPASGEMYTERYAGDFSDLLLSYQSQPEFRELYEQPATNWMRRLVCDVMYTHFEGVPMARALEPYVTSSCIWFLGYPWGNYGPDHQDPCRNGKHHDVWNISTEYRAMAPQHKLSSYHNFLFDEGSDTFRERPWMGVRDREGQLVGSGINSDTTRGASFFYQMGNPAIREFLIKMQIEQVRQWGFDYLYFDGPGWGAEIPDWGALQVSQSYDWIELLRGLHRELKRLDNEQLIFVNGILPFSQIGYIEYRDAQWKDLGGSEWRSIASDLWSQKLTDPDGFLRVPTYGFIAADPALAAYQLFYGWSGNLADVRRAPWMLAAYELFYGRMQRGAVSPNWLREETELEAAAFTREGRGWLTLLNHAPDARTYDVTVKTAALGLTPGRPLKGWRWEMEQPDPSRPELTKDTPVEALQAEARRPVMHRKPLTLPAACPETLALNLELQPVATNVVFLTHRPALIESVAGIPLAMGLGHPDVWMEERPADGGGQFLVVVNRANAAVLALPDVSAAAIAPQTGHPCEITDGEWGGGPAAKTALQKGRYEFKIQ